jgi:hypothetical protein
MRPTSPLFNSFLLTAALVLPLATIGCSEHHYYRAYDPYYHDYHRWDNRETIYYQQWENENHHEHRDFRQRNADEQKEYWNWRHSHADHDHDHDRDKR